MGADGTRIPGPITSEERRALDLLYSATYEELRRLAASVRRGSSLATLTPTTLVNEAWMKLARSPAVASTTRLHFKRIAARAMRQVLVEAARRKTARKRGGGGMVAITLDDSMPDVSASKPEEILALDDALEELSRLEPRQAQMVECRFFAGLDVAETAEVCRFPKQPSSATGARPRHGLRGPYGKAAAEAVPGGGEDGKCTMGADPGAVPRGGRSPGGRQALPPEIGLRRRRGTLRGRAFAARRGRPRDSGARSGPDGPRGSRGAGARRGLARRVQDRQRARRGRNGRRLSRRAQGRRAPRRAQGASRRLGLAGQARTLRRGTADACTPRPSRHRAPLRQRRAQ